MFDFLLVSQKVRQGTVTPVHYNVIFDNTNFDPDKHQEFFSIVFMIEAIVKKSSSFFFELCALCISILGDLRNWLNQTIFQNSTRKTLFRGLFYD